MASKPNSTKQIGHQFGPCWDPSSRVLILGSFPSVKSREANFYYGHPQNRFWPLMAKTFGKPVGSTIEEKRAFLKDAYLALYDVIEFCTISGSSDSSIKNVIPTDISQILGGSCIEKVILNGKTASRYFAKYHAGKIPEGVRVICLPSTSPANAACRFDELYEAWKKELSFLL